MILRGILSLERGSSWLVSSSGLSAVALLSITGCANLPRDDGQIWSCFGLVTEDVAGGTQTDTNIYFGGCSPADPGLQVVTYARATATEAEIVALIHSALLAGTAG